MARAATPGRGDRDGARSAAPRGMWVPADVAARTRRSDEETVAHEAVDDLRIFAGLRAEAARQRAEVGV